MPPVRLLAGAAAEGTTESKEVTAGAVVDAAAFAAAAAGGGGAVTVEAAMGNALLDTQSTEPTLPLLPVDGDKLKW